MQAEAGKTLTEAQWSFGEERRRCRWIRIEVVDPDGKRTWTNPLATEPSA